MKKINIIKQRGIHGVQSILQNDAFTIEIRKHTQTTSKNEKRERKITLLMIIVKSSKPKQ